MTVIRHLQLLCDDIEWGTWLCVCVAQIRLGSCLIVNIVVCLDIYIVYCDLWIE